MAERPNVRLATLMDLWRRRDLRYSGSRYPPTREMLAAARLYREKEALMLLSSDDAQQKALAVLDKWMPG